MKCPEILGECRVACPSCCLLLQDPYSLGSVFSSAAQSKTNKNRTQNKTHQHHKLGSLEAIEIPSYVSSVWDFLAEHTAVFDPQMLPPCCVLRW